MTSQAARQKQWEQCSALYQQNKLPQALLFSGKAGLGKVQFAHDFVQWVLCQAATHLPCGICQSCRWMLANAHPECFIVAPSENSKNNAVITVDQIRELISVTQLMPQHAQKKWILIEQADKLNVAASNALLKILEEPTETTMFIMISSHKQALQQTIISRLTEISFTASMLSEQPEQTVAQRECVAELAALSDLSAHSVDLSLLAERWAKRDHNNTLYLFYNWLSDLIYLKMDKNAGASKVINQEYLTTLYQIVTHCSATDLFSLLREVDEALILKRQVPGINDQLCLEKILINYLKII